MTDSQPQGDDRGQQPFLVAEAVSGDVVGKYCSPGVNRWRDSRRLPPGRSSGGNPIGAWEKLLAMGIAHIETALEADRLEPRLLSKAAIVGPPQVYEIRSPDGRWHLGAADDNLYLRSVIDGHMEGLTNDASKDFGWAFEWNTLPVWSPDTHLIAVKRTGRLSHQQANGDSEARSAPPTATTLIRSLIICCHLERDHKSLKPTRRQALSLTAYNACLVDQFTIRQLTISEVARHAEKASTWA